MMEFVSIGQREAGIIAPEKDSNGVQRIGTYGMSTCFALGVYDTEARVAFLTHSDIVGDVQLPYLLGQLSPELYELGARNLIIETVNTRTLFGNPLRPLIVTKGISVLRKNGFRIVPSVNAEGREQDWIDKGFSTAVVLGLNHGIQKLSYEGYSRLMLEHAIDERGLLNEAKRVSTNFRIKLSYKPQRVK